MADKNKLRRHRLNWWFQADEIEGESDTPQPSGYYDRIRAKDILIICPDGNTLNEKKGDGDIWKDFLFTDPQLVQGRPFYTFTDHIHHQIPEFTEHREMHPKHYQGQKLIEYVEDDFLADDDLEPPRKYRHVERPHVVLSMMATPLPMILFVAQPKVASNTRALFPMPYAFADHQHEGCADETEILSELVARSMPPLGWVSQQMLDKNQLVSGAGKLRVLYSMLKRLLEQGHRIIIYSQMTNMIALLESFMSYRKQAYMRLDRSKMSSRHSLTDFEARAEVSVFLISTPIDRLAINFTYADTVIFYDSNWNPSVDMEAIERARNLGKINHVNVYRLISKGTIEERIVQCASKKRERSRSLASGIERMLVSDGKFKLDSLKPKEMLSLLLDDEVIKLKCLQILEQQRRKELKRRKRLFQPLATFRACSSRGIVTFYQNPVIAGDYLMRGPLMEGDDDSNLIVDTPRVEPVVLAPDNVDRRVGNRRRVRQRGVCSQPLDASREDSDSEGSLEVVEVQPAEEGFARHGRLYPRELGQRGIFSRRTRPRLMPRMPHF